MRPSDAAQIQRLSMGISPDSPLSTVNQFGVAISPDAKHVAYVAIKDRVRFLYLRDLGLNTAIPIQGTERANRPFFSPDGEWIGFFAGGKLKKVSVSTGLPGGRVILFTRAEGRPEIALLSSDTKSVRTLLPGLGAPICEIRSSGLHE